MSKALFQLQNNIKNLREELNDRIHLAYLNHQSYLCLKSSSTLPLQEIPSNLQTELEASNSPTSKSNSKFEKLKQATESPSTDQLNIFIEEKLKNLSQIFQKRSQNHLNYLIIRQIQSEQECVRRDRLAEYQEKIYDQRRLISDKEVFTQSLLRPKKQRPDNMTSEQFADVRATEKVEEEKGKIAALDDELRSMQIFRKKICEFQIKNDKEQSSFLLKKSKEIYSKIKSEDLQKTKAYSLDTVNTSNNMNTICEKQEKPFEEDFNGEIPVINQKEVSRSENDGVKPLTEQNEKQKESCNGCYSVELQKLIQGFQKKANPEEIRQKYRKISQLLNRIKQKKAQNAARTKEWKELEMENTHMKVHLKKTKQLYLQTKNARSSLMGSPK